MAPEIQVCLLRLNRLHLVYPQIQITLHLLRTNVNNFQKKLQKNLQVKKKCVSLQPV